MNDPSLPIYRIGRHGTSQVVIMLAQTAKPILLPISLLCAYHKPGESLPALPLAAISTHPFKSQSLIINLIDLARSSRLAG